MVRDQGPMGRVVLAMLAASLLAASMFVAVTPAGAAITMVVDSTADDPDANPGNGACQTSLGQCTLRAAIEEANALAGTDTIEIPAGNYALDSQLDITSSMHLIGAGAFQTLIDGDDSTNIFFLADAGGTPYVTMRDLSIQNGLQGQVGGVTAGLYVEEDVTATLTRVRVRNNESRVFGGGIHNQGYLTLIQSEVTGNTLPPGGGGQTSQGGGIFNIGTLYLHRSFVDDNFATRGGGISNTNEGRVWITNSTISDNHVAGAGGGIRNVADGRVNINNSTIVDNEANSGGGDGASDTFGGGIYNAAPARISMGNSILARNTDNRWHGHADHSPDCWSPDDYLFRSERYNVVGVLNDNCVFEDGFWGNTNWIEFGTPASPLNPGLNAYPSGSMPRVYPLQSTSIAVDLSAAPQGSFFFDCEDIDAQAGVRPKDGDLDGSLRCDAGASEYTPSIPNELRQCVVGTATVVIPWGQEPTEGDDIIVGSPGDDDIDGLGGNDVICGWGGDDTIDAGPGHDIVDAGDGDDEVYGRAGNDYLWGGPGNDTLWGSAGQDVLEGAEGADYLHGGDDVDFIRGGDGYDEMWGDGGDDWLDSGPSADDVDGGAGNDVILGDGGNDNLDGGPGADFIRGGNSEATLSGGPGDDWLEGGVAPEGLSGGDGNDVLLGGGGDDSLFGGADSDYLQGDGGNDFYDGGDGRDTLEGGAEGETMRGGGGDDLIFGRGGDDDLEGDAGSDYLDGGGGSDSCDGGSGVDFAEPNCEVILGVP